MAVLCHNAHLLTPLKEMAKQKPTIFPRLTAFNLIRPTHADSTLRPVLLYDGRSL
ncbi:unnamed protein product [Leuciscus chuanchicus]